MSDCNWMVKVSQSGQKNCQPRHRLAVYMKREDCTGRQVFAQLHRQNPSLKCKNFPSSWYCCRVYEVKQTAKTLGTTRYLVIRRNSQQRSWQCVCFISKVATRLWGEGTSCDSAREEEQVILGGWSRLTKREIGETNEQIAITVGTIHFGHSSSTQAGPLYFSRPGC